MTQRTYQCVKANSCIWVPLQERYACLCKKHMSAFSRTYKCLCKKHLSDFERNIWVPLQETSECLWKKHLSDFKRNIWAPLQEAWFKAWTKLRWYIWLLTSCVNGVIQVSSQVKPMTKQWWTQWSECHLKSSTYLHDMPRDICT